MTSSYLVTDELPLLLVVVATQQPYLVRGEVHRVLREIEREREREREAEKDRKRDREREIEREGDIESQRERERERENGERWR